MTPAFIKTERKTEELHPNPINPRTLKEKAFKELQKSLKDDPHFFQARPLIVSMAEGRENTIIAGNQRLEAAKALGWATVPVIEVRGATLEEEKQWMVKDNLHKGEWDFEKLADGFDLDFLKEIGFDEDGLSKILNPEIVSDISLPDGDRPGSFAVTFSLSAEQKETVEVAISKAKEMGPFADTGNENTNGNALARICEIFYGDQP